MYTFTFVLVNTVITSVIVGLCAFAYGYSNGRKDATDAYEAVIDTL